MRFPGVVLKLLFSTNVGDRVTRVGRSVTMATDVHGVVMVSQMEIRTLTARPRAATTPPSRRKLRASLHRKKVHAYYDQILHFVFLL